MICCNNYLNYKAQTRDMDPYVIKKKSDFLSILPETKVIHICDPKCIMKADR